MEEKRRIAGGYFYNVFLRCSESSLDCKKSLSVVLAGWFYRFSAEELYFET